MAAIQEKVLARRYVRLRDKNQITLPSEIMDGIAIKPGDFLEIVLTADHAIEMIPTKLISRVDSQEARDQEKLAEADISQGNYGSFERADDLMKDAAAKNKPSKKPTKKVAVAGCAK